MTTEHTIYTKAMELYNISFPFHEQRDAASQKRIMNNNEYHFNLIYDENTFVGLILYWETTSFIYVEHFCVFPSMRNKKYGQKALELLKQRGKTVILEIDPPVDEISIRRSLFYARANYKLNDYKHFHLAYHVGYQCHQLVVMSWPDTLSKELYNDFAQYLRKVVMSAEL